MEWPKRARTADWENGVLALDREKQFEVPKLTAEIMERLAGYTLVGFHVKGYPVTDELLAPFAGHKSMVNFGVENGIERTVILKEIISEYFCIDVHVQV